MDLAREPDRTASAPDLGPATAAPPPSLRALRGLGRTLLRQPRPIALLAPLAWMALIWFLSAQEVGRNDDPSPLHSLVWNLAHGPEYATLALLLLPLLPRRDGWVVLGRAQMLFVVAVAGGYGVVDELHQGTVRGRSSSASDAVTDLCAIAAVLVIARYVGRPGADARGLHRRLVACALLVVGGAVLATFEHLISFSP